MIAFLGWIHETLIQSQYGGKDNKLHRYVIGIYTPRASYKYGRQFTCNKWSNICTQEIKNKQQPCRETETAVNMKLTTVNMLLTTYFWQFTGQCSLQQRSMTVAALINYPDARRISRTLAAIILLCYLNNIGYT